MSYFDPHAEAQMNGFSHGHIQGKQAGMRQGFDEGEQEGYTEGQRIGYDTGWNDCLAAANVQMLKQMEYTRQHVADKAVLIQQIEQQRQQIEQLTAKLDAMEKENSTLKKSNQGWRDVVKALQDANERLRVEVSQLDEKFQQQSKEYVDHLWQYNKSLVFTNSVRAVLEDLTSDSSDLAKRVQQMFATRYSAEVIESMKDGSIRIPPEKDREFATEMPKTHEFIMNMINAVAQHSTQKLHSEAENHVNNSMRM